MTYAWHVHHEQLIEELTVPIEDRRRYIVSNKPMDEIAIRLRLLKVVQDQEAVASAKQAHNMALLSASKTYDDSLVASGVDSAVAERAGEIYDATLRTANSTYTNAINDLHAKECPSCPWDGRTIFSASSEVLA